MIIGIFSGRDFSGAAPFLAGVDRLLLAVGGVLGPLDNVFLCLLCVSLVDMVLICVETVDCHQLREWK